MKTKKILLFKLGAMGDILFSTPFQRELRRKNQQAKIDFLIGRGSQAILQGNKFIDSVIPFDEKVFIDRQPLRRLGLIKQIRSRGYDEMYVLDKHWKFALFAYLCGIRARAGFLRDNPSTRFLTKTVPYCNQRHEVDYYLSLIDENSSSVDRRLIYKPTAESEQTIRSFLRDQGISSYVVLVNSGGHNPGERTNIRRMPGGIMTKLVDALSQQHNLIFVGSAEEKAYYDGFVCNHRVINLAGQFSLDQSIALLQFATRVYSTECGVMHMAACVNQHITGFFGPTRPARRKPFIEDFITVWEDEDIYDPAYELNGTLPSQSGFFQRIDVAQAVTATC